MMSGFQQYITEYTIANFWRYPIRRVLHEYIRIKDNVLNIVKAAVGIASDKGGIR